MTLLKSLEVLQNLRTKLIRPAPSDQGSQSTIFHPEVLNLEDALKIKEDWASDDLISETRIPLPFASRIHIGGKSNLFLKALIQNCLC